MGELIKYEPIQGLNPLDSSVVIASKGKKLFHMEDKELKILITTVITMALFDLGQSMATPDRELLESRLKDDLIKYFGKFTGEEIKKAIEMGVRGSFKSKPDEVLFISIRAIHEWIKKYESLIKLEAMKNNRILEEKKEKEQVEADIESKKEALEKASKRDLINSFEQFKNGGQIYDPINILYDYLDKRGLVKLSNERKKVIYDQAFEEFKRKHTDGSSIAEYLSNKKVMAEIENGSDRVNVLVKVIAKQKALREIFKDINELGLTIEEFLNEPNT